LEILIIESNELTNRMLEFILTSAGYKVWSAFNISEARRFLENVNPSLIILNRRPEDGDGLKFCVELVSNNPEIPVVFIANEVTLACKVEGLKYATDYLTLPFEPAEFLARVKAILRRVRQVPDYMAQNYIKAGEVELDISTLKVTLSNNKAVFLSPTEMKIMGCLMVQAGQIVSRNSLVEHVWGFEYEGESNLVNVHIKNIRSKLSPGSPRMTHIETIKGVGYRFRQPSKVASNE
jgi:two-component system alkaline phosphatase synthesis response regulator PhoP